MQQAFVLPAQPLAALLSRRLAGSELLVPQPTPAQVAAVWRALDATAATLRRTSLADRARRLVHGAEQLRPQGPGAEWEDLLVRSTGLSGPGLRAAWETTFAPWDASRIADLLQQEDLDAMPADDIPRRIVHILAGNVLPPTFSMLARGYLLGAAQWIRPASREPVFAACVVQRLAAEIGDLASAVLWWPHGDPIEPEVLRGADLVTATGDDETIETLRQRASLEVPVRRFLGYGARWSLVLLSRAAQTRDTARAVAWDVSLFDQQGCLSPSLVLAEAGSGLEAWCDHLAGALQALEIEMPRGEPSWMARAGLRLWQENERLGLATGAVRRLWEGSGTAWAVSLRNGPEFVDSPLDRHVPVVEFQSLESLPRILGARRSSLQGVAADWSGWDAAACEAVLGMLRPSRLAPPGKLQLAPPAWPQDHRAPLRSWCSG